MNSDTQSPSLKNILPGVFWVTASKYGSFFINLIAQLALVRILVPEDFGKFALAVAIVDIILLFISAWSFPLALIQIKGVRHLESTVLSLSLAAFCLVAAISALGYIIVIKFYGAETAVLFCGLALVKGLSLLSKVYSALLRREFNFKSWSLVQAAASIISTFTALGAAVAGFGLWSLFIREAVLQVISYVGFRILSNWSYGLKFDREAAKRIFSFCSRIAVAQGLEALFFRLDKLLVGVLFGNRELGFYERAQWICLVATGSMSTLSATIGFPAFASVQTDTKKLEKGLNVSNFFFTRISFMIIPTVVLFPAETVEILFGAQWASMAPVLKWFALYVFLGSIFTNLRIVLYVRGRISSVIKARGIQIISFVLLMPILTGDYGVAGAASAYVLSASFGLIILLQGIRNEGLVLQFGMARPLLALFITIAAFVSLDDLLLNVPTILKLLMPPFFFGATLTFLEMERLVASIKLLLQK